MIDSKTFTFNKIPTSLEEFKSLGFIDNQNPYSIAAAAVIAYAVYPINKEACFEMLDFLKGPKPLTPYDKSFMKDRFMDGDYVAKSYFNGATPQNNYTVNAPYSITIMKGAHNEDCINEGYLKLFVRSGGADSERSLNLRVKASTGEWFLWEQYILVSIRKPVAADPWA